ncbi:hypothetical protein PUNSTDRAFT_118183 [Punctularia strigosozonata HHB-11173 SS5]|uniref:uncharacterized protein n=1 Tax=Punctularia strigosozonata (strain HHB-11173) TaxID=741275 RepID=UPI0004418260|nr:uncharacterized protein PUNSTDRAFT_118183 [Punctularia strigosozonata HHB-11173 SS5]EIN12240.1 hypothetical protein PUNSTDRAFT_118183 [Punctularia strigosozonata HHB-11173 SS5]
MVTGPPKTKKLRPTGPSIAGDTRCPCGAISSPSRRISLKSTCQSESGRVCMFTRPVLPNSRQRTWPSVLQHEPANQRKYHSRLLVQVSDVAAIVRRTTIKDMTYSGRHQRRRCTHSFDSAIPLRPPPALSSSTLTPYP